MRGLSAAIILALVASGAEAQVVLSGAPVSENFDTLASAGSSSTMPTGWAFLETGGNGTYTATDGNSTSGDSYSVGAVGSSERAFGSIGSGTVTRVDVGAQLSNQTGSNVGQLTISYVGEQWRLGDVTAPLDRLDFQYSLDATSLNTGTWIDVNELDFVSPVGSGTAGPLNGNLPANRSAISHTITGLNLAAGATLWIRWTDLNTAGVDDLVAVDEVVISTTGAVDVPPTVTSTVPANGATGVAPSSNIQVNFSEAVTTQAGWFALSCSSTGTVSVAESGAGATRTLDPVPTLAFGENCNASIDASKVIDQDGTPDPMAANVNFGFTVAQDLAPTVASTVPANNQSNVPRSSNININFSEAVTVSGSWYTLQCSVSGTPAVSVSGGPISYTLDPAADLAELENCVVTVLAAQVLDQDGTPTPMASDFSFNFTTAAGAGNYYASVDATSASTLRNTLHALIDDHTAYQYSIGSNNCNAQSPTTAACDVWDILEEAEQDLTESNKVLDVYRNRKYLKITDRSGATGPTTYNREHTWPNSLGFNDLNGLDGGGRPFSPYTDAHMLYASASDYNSNRGNKPYDNCSAACTENPTDLNHGAGGGTGTYPGNSNWVQGTDGNTGTYEVWGKRKGDVARAILYMDVRYEGGSASSGQPEPNLIVTNNRSLIQNTPSGQVPAEGYMGVLDTLIAWHNADPPDAQEVLRNEVVYKYQGNRNPFIDRPEWVACLWQNNCPPPVGPNIFANGFE